MKKYFELGDSAWAAGNLYGAFRLFLAGAKAGDSSCAHNLGYFYDNGIGVGIVFKHPCFHYDNEIFKEWDC